MRALGDLVQAGKVRYLGFSDAPAKMSLVISALVEVAQPVLMGYKNAQ
jgi:aryl-alcohol dehydrogenase-like predicted oxidoreductase